MKRIAAVLMLAAMSLAAQDSKDAQSKPPEVIVRKLFVLKYADPEQVNHLLMMLGGSGSSSSSSREMHAIAVNANQGLMTVIEDAIKQLDVPSAAPTNIELTVNLIVGTEAESGIGGPVPKEMESVVTQLKGAFPFKSYRQVDQIELRTRTGERASSRSEGAAVLKDPPPVPAGATHAGDAKPQATTIITYFVIRAASLAQDGSAVRLDNMEASISWPGVDNNLSLNTSVDVKEGQKVVVGRIGVAHDQALFVVLTAHVVQ
jgi:hypothetical protein